MTELTWEELDRMVEGDPIAMRDRAWAEIVRLRGAAISVGNAEDRLAEIISWAAVDPKAFSRDCSELAGVILAAGYRRGPLSEEGDSALCQLAARRINESIWANDRMGRDIRGALATLSGWMELYVHLPVDDQPRAAAVARAFLGAPREEKSG
jgi:hypothetical protein